ncbi:T9SS type A sorting domain-containing protein [Flavobacteriaceae bacterium TK19130]|nr:T9SS type A sorting domain-containing protein [Thermobacterium salinum]
MMRNLLLSILILSGVSASAQLFVRPNPSTSTDSYVYVNDVELFVNDDVNLQLNTNDPDTEASIYLRNNAQLLQGSNVASNNGNGMLSVYQTVDETSNYHYTYWHSPVGVPNGSGNQNSGVRRLFDCDGCTDVTTAAAAVNTTWNQNGSSLTDPITVSYRWTYKRLSSPPTEAEGNYVRIWAGDNAQPGYGFIMKGVSNGAVTQSQTYDFRGRPNNGTINVPVNTGSTQWTLMGNPYPSALDLKDFMQDNPSVAVIRYWDEPKFTEYSHNYIDKSGGYGTWVPLGFDETNPAGLYTAASFMNYSFGGFGGTTGGTGADLERRHAPIGQGFVVETDGTAGTITFDNTQRTFQRQGAGNYSEFRSQDNPNSMTGNDADEVSEFDTRSPYLKFDVFMDESHFRQLALVFDDQTTDGYDWGWDASHPMDAPGGDAYLLIGEDSNRSPYVVNACPFDYMKMIPIGIKVPQQRQVLFVANEEVKMNDKTAYLYDSVNNTYDKFNEGETASILLPAGTYDNRFFIVFRGASEIAADANSTRESIVENVNFFQNNRLSQLEVTNPEQHDIKQGVVFDMSGKLVYSESNIGTKTSFSIPTGDLSDGVYLVKLTTTDNVDITYKTSVVNR